MRVLRHERVVRPIDSADAEGGAALPLVRLELLAEVLALLFGAHGEHIGPVDQPTVLQAGDAEYEALQHPGVVEGAGDHASRLEGDEEHRGGDLLGEAAAPGELLQLDAGGPVRVGGQVTDQHEG